MTREGPEPALPSTLEGELQAEKLRSARRISVLRLCGTSLFFALFFVFGELLGLPEWQGNFPLFFLYLVASVLLWRVTNRSARWARLATLAIGILDMPMVFFIQRSTLDSSPSASGVAGFTVGVYVLLISFASLSLERWQIYVAAAIGTVLEVLLQWLAGVGVGGMVASAMLLGISAAVCGYASQRLGALIARVVSYLAEREQIQAQLRFADRMRSVGTLAAGVAHEINNPLVFLIGNLDYLGRAVAKEGELSSAVADAKEGAERVRTIVQGLKTLSHRDDEQKALIDVGRVLDYALKIAAEQIRKKAALVTRLEPMPQVLANESRLGQVFVNLLVNAAQAIPEGARAEHRVEVATSVDPSGRVVVEVSDSGTGIAPEHLGQLFDPFFTTKPVGLGTGLGLSICHGIVTSLGGEISVHSEPGKGSTFRVALPAAGKGLTAQR